MFRYIMAFAATALLASQVQAATINAPAMPLQAGVPYTFTYTPDSPTEILDTYDFYILRLTVTDSTRPGEEASFGFSGTIIDPNETFDFPWIFNSTGSAILSVVSWYNTYRGAELVQGPFGPIAIEGEGFKEARSSFSEAVSLRISVVPIGGTLPLLVSALGLMGWAARRRAQKVALPA